MKKTINIFFAVALSVLMLSGCIKETFPEDAIATSEQIGSSASALEAAVNGIPSQMCQGYLVYGTQTYEYDMGFPGIMLMQSEALGDMYPLIDPGYDWYYYWGSCMYMGAEYAPTYIIFRTLYMFVKSANDVISAVDLDDEDLTATQRGYAGIAYACRAFDYYYLMTLFQPVTNPYQDISDDLHRLTVPFVTDKTESSELFNNPRADIDDMLEFIYSDLDTAEECLKDWSPSSRLFPSLAVVYAIRARVCMWAEDWAGAVNYANLAIETAGVEPMSETQLTDFNTAFNTATPAWLWYIHYDPENMGNLCNYIGWTSSEAQWGYGHLDGPGIDRSLYDHISDTDYRKHQFVDPDKYDYYDYQSSVTDWDFIADCEDYTSIKFRCIGGECNDYASGGNADVPVIRIEEMYFILAEATARSQGVSAGVNVLNSFMKSYRDPEYNYTGSDLDAFAQEVLKQMQIEFWGEGTAFQTAKRIKPGVMKNYTGTNCPDDGLKINSREIQPNWNLVISILETQNNQGIVNNPDPTGLVQGPSPIDEYAEPGYVPSSGSDE